MSRPTRREVAGAVYLDLQRAARQAGRTTQDVLTMYVVERWLARLAVSPHADDFVLKGGMLLAAFGQRRTTVDADTRVKNLVRVAMDAHLSTANVKLKIDVSFGDPITPAPPTAENRHVDLRPQSMVLRDFTVLRSDNYATARERLRTTALPESFTDVVAYADPLLN